MYDLNVTELTRSVYRDKRVSVFCAREARSPRLLPVFLRGWHCSMIACISALGLTNTKLFMVFNRLAEVVCS